MTPQMNNRMTPEEMQQARYRSAAGPSNAMPAAPASMIRGGAPVGNELGAPMPAQQNRMPAPWLQQPMQGQQMAHRPMQPVPQTGRMPAPWMQQGTAGAGNRPMYQGAGQGPGQRAQTSAPQQPGTPMNMRQQVQQDQNRQNNTF